MAAIGGRTVIPITSKEPTLTTKGKEIRHVYNSLLSIQFNQFIPYFYFKIEGLLLVKELLCPNDCIRNL